MAGVSINNHSQIDETDRNTSTLINRDDEPLISYNNDQTQVDTSLSSTNAQSNDQPLLCRLCHCQGTNDEPLISTCYCVGTTQYLHQSCLQCLIKDTDVKSCELCKYKYLIHEETKPFKQWQKLNMNAGETCKVVCSVACSFIVGICVLWILYVLIEKTREEIQFGKLQWPFWTKLLITAILFCGGLILLCVQFKMYFKLCTRWRRFNQRIVVRSKHDQENDEKFPSRMKYFNKNHDDCVVTIPDDNN